MKDLKYLAAFSIPIVAVTSLFLKGPYTYLTPFYAFVILPFLELVLPLDPDNLSKEEALNQDKKSIFDWMLYLNIPIVFSLVFYALMEVVNSSLAAYEFFGMILSVGIVLSVNGINVGHELGHRQKSNERFLGKLLLLPSLYMHFYIEHNHGHHLHAATKEDPATARYNQSVYSFWFTSIIRQYINAWRLQKKLLKNADRMFMSLKNDMLWYMVLQTFYLFVVFLLFGGLGLIFAVSTAIVGFLLLETVNYIEHYGLLRVKKPSGRYERVKEVHSWNSNHVLGRIVLYELTRHSDHHYKSSKKYQILDCHQQSPQLPYGYPTSVVIALIPPLWFKIMNKRIPQEMISD
jgi:alkane 1-monooxygenase